MSLNATNLFIQASPLPATFMGTPNDLFAEMIKRMRILSPSGTNFIFIGDTEPASNVGPWLKNGTQWYVWDPVTKHYVPQDITASFTPAFSIGNSAPATTNPPVWLKTTKNPTGANPLDYGDFMRWLVWNGTQWAAPNPVEASSPERRIWMGAESSLWSYDGGDGTDPSVVAPTDYTGAMWRVDTVFSFRVPIGAGTNPTTYDGNPATVIGVGDTGGAERVALTEDELAAHRHLLAANDSQNDPLPPGATDRIASDVGYTAQIDSSYELGASALEATIAQSSPTGGGKSHQNLPPFVGVFFIKRTARKYYTS